MAGSPTTPRGSLMRAEDPAHPPALTASATQMPNRSTMSGRAVRYERLTGMATRVGSASDRPSADRPLER